MGSCETIRSDITINFMDEPQVDAGSDESTEAGEPVDLSSSFIPPAADNAAGLRWSSTGTGTFNDPEILHPTYTPSTEEEGNTVLTLTVTGWQGCTTVSDEMNLEVIPLVTALDNLNRSNGLKYHWDTERRLLSVWMEEPFNEELSWSILQSDWAIGIFRNTHKKRRFSEVSRTGFNRRDLHILP